MRFKHIPVWRSADGPNHWQTAWAGRCCQCLVQLPRECWAGWMGSGVWGNIPGTGAVLRITFKNTQLSNENAPQQQFKENWAISELSTRSRQRCSCSCYTCCFGGTEGPEESENKAMRQSKLWRVLERWTFFKVKKQNHNTKAGTAISQELSSWFCY